MSSWDKIRGFPPFVAALLAIAAAIVTVITWVTGYFATQNQLDFVKCISDGNEKLLGLQLRTQNEYGKYLNQKSMLTELKERQEKSGISSDSERASIQKLETDTEITYDSLTHLRKKADALAIELAAGACGKKGAA